MSSKETVATVTEIAKVLHTSIPAVKHYLYAGMPSDINERGRCVVDVAVAERWVAEFNAGKAVPFGPVQIPINEVVDKLDICRSIIDSWRAKGMATTDLDGTRCVARPVLEAWMSNAAVRLNARKASNLAGLSGTEAIYYWRAKGLPSWRWRGECYFRPSDIAAYVNRKYNGIFQYLDSAEVVA